MVKEFKSNSTEDTELLAERIGKRLKGGEVIELISDLGGGKTTFVRGLARGLGSKDRVASPTFTVSKVYRSDKLEVVHFDFYRLKEAGLMVHELHDFIDDPNIVIVVEWADIIAHVLPEKRLTVNLQRTGDEKRLIKINCPDSLSYLMEGL